MLLAVAVPQERSRRRKSRKFGEDLLPLHLLGEGYGGLGHALLVLALVDLQVMGLLGQRLTQAHHVAVSGDHEDAPDEPGDLSVHVDELVLQKAHQRLGHG